MLKVVFDTVVFVRALLNQKSVCGRLVFGHPDRYQLYLSTPVVIEILQVLARDELVGKLERRRGTYLHVIAGLLETFQQAQAVELAAIPAISRDPKDDKVLATAKAAGADYLVSEDQDLLVLGVYEGTQIVNAATFLGVLERQDR
jgi:putative PIN family toxin of toxin-antitoxin system